MVVVTVVFCCKVTKVILRNVVFKAEFLQDESSDEEYEVIKLMISQIKRPQFKHLCYL